MLRSPECYDRARMNCFTCKDEQRLFEQLLENYRVLHAAVVKHMQRGNDSCWENDLELWRTTDSGIQYPHKELPSKEEFLANCRKYYQSRLEAKCQHPLEINFTPQWCEHCEKTPCRFNCGKLEKDCWETCEYD